MALAQKASPPRSDGTAQGAEDTRAGYALQMSDPPASYGLPPILYAGDYGAFSNPSGGTPLRGEAVAYLMSWASRLSAAAATATVQAYGGGETGIPQPVWDRADSGDPGPGTPRRLAWLKGAFQVPSYSGPHFDLFRMRLLDFLRLRRVPVGVPCGEDPPAPSSWLVSKSDDDSGGYDGYDPSPPPDLASPPVFVEGYLAAETQAGIDANGGNWLVPVAEGAEDRPFGYGPGGAAAPGDTPLNRFVLEYMASLSGPQPDVALRDCGFASRYAVPPLVLPPREPGGPDPDPVPDPDFVQGPEPFLASDAHDLFLDALESGRSRVWAGCAGLNLFADLGDLKTVPAVTETRWRARARVVYRRWAAASPDSVLDSYDETSDWVDVGSGELPDETASYSWPVGHADVSWTWTGFYGNWKVDAWDGVSFAGQGGFGNGHPVAVDRSYPNGAVVRRELDVYVEMAEYDREVVPARTYRGWGSSALPNALSFSFRSVARLEPTDPAEWWAEHPGPTDAEKAAWFEGAFGVDPDDPYLEELWIKGGGASGSASWGTSWSGSVADAWADCVGEPPPDPYTGTVEWADSVTVARDRPYHGPGEVEDEDGLSLPEIAGRGLPEGWYLGSSDWWVVGSSGTGWGECHSGINWAGHQGEDTGWEEAWADSGAPPDGAGRFEVEYVAEAPAAGGVAGPLCPGGVPVPVQSADSVAVLPLFCATVTVKTTAVKTVSRTGTATAIDGGTYDRLDRSGRIVRSSETRYVVGFAPVPCLWTRDAGDGSAGSSERYPLGEGPGPAALWEFVKERVLSPAGMPLGARDLLSGKDVSYERYQHAPMGSATQSVAVPHDAVGARWIRMYWEGGQLVQDVREAFAQAVSFERDGDSVEYAEVSGTVEFPFCVFESGYCA